MSELREVVWQGRTFMVDEHGVVQHDVDMEAYDAALIEAGFEFVDGDEDETELTFLVDAESDASEHRDAPGASPDHTPR